MVVVNARTNIFNLIENEASKVADFMKLYTISPEKFKLNDKDGNNIFKFAYLHKRTDLIKYFKTLNLFENPSNTIDPEKLVNDIIKIIKSKKDDETIINGVKDVIKDIDLSKFPKQLIKNLINTILVEPYRSLTLENDILFELVEKGVDINIRDLDKFPPLFYKLFNPINSERAKYILDTYKPDIKNIFRNETPLLYFVLKSRAIDNVYSTMEKYNVIKAVLEYGLEHGITISDIHTRMFTGAMKHNYISYIYKFATPVIKENLYKLFIEHGANIDSPLNEENFTLLIQSILDGNIPLIDSCLENGANVNHITTDNVTPIVAAILENKTNIIKKLIEKGADVNIPAGRNKFSPLRFAISSTVNLPLDIVKLLLDSGANKDYKSPVDNLTTLEYAIIKYKTDKEYYKHVIELLGGKIPEEEKWKGFSRSDIEKFDIFFEKPFDWSCCPICLEYVERSDGCMYMSHDCKTRKHFYHTKLYDKFVYDYYGNPRIEWCTICGRITKNHKHYVLSFAQTPFKELAPLKPEIQEQLHQGDNIAFFDNANCIGFGGGGTEEKAARFRRMREYALELQDDVAKKLENEAMEELIEEAWNAPLVRNKKIKKILEDKRWNINVKEFPENKRNTRNNNNNNTNAANIPFNGVKPTIIEDDCIIFRKDQDTNTQETNPKYHFHHETIGGIDHEGIYICQKDLATAIEVKNAEFGLDTFTKCWWHYTCKANLHPEELKGIIPDVLYEEYRKKFNKKMKQNGGTRKLKKQMMRGGNATSMLYELEDGTCTPHNWTRDGKVRKL